MKNKSVHCCRFVHHAKFHCIMTSLNKLFKIELKGGGLEKSPKLFKNCSPGNLYERFVVEICSSVHTDTF